MVLGKLKFGKGNAKLGNNVYTFDLPAGWTCPFAKTCLSKVVDGKVVDGPHTQFRCYAASIEALRKQVCQNHWRNLQILLTSPNMRYEIDECIPVKASKIRLHSSGDFFSLKYMRAWRDVAKSNPHIMFYAYTKAIPFWLRLGELPRNFVLTASLGGTHDLLIKKHKLRYCKVVFSLEEAEKSKLKIDHDDSLACNWKVKRFALLLHGIQPANSKASLAKVRLGSVGWTGYGRSK